MKSRATRILALAVAALGASAAQAQEKFTFLTNWYAQAEHGGFYQALASGLYKKEGLDVTIKMGGPQVNGMQLLAAGQTDCFMGYDSQTIKAWENGINAVTVAAAFQKDPQVLIGHPGVVNKMDDLKGKTILISQRRQHHLLALAEGHLQARATRRRGPTPSTSSPSSPTRTWCSRATCRASPTPSRRKPSSSPPCFLLSDYGWPPYSTTIVCMEDTVKKKPKAVAAFVKASMQGWKDYLKGDPSAANALIKKDNPNMTDDKIAVGIKLLNETGMVFGGDAAKMGVGIVTDERMKKTYDMMVAMKLLDPSQGRPEEDLHHRVRQGPEDHALTRPACRYR